MCFETSENKKNMTTSVITHEISKQINQLPVELQQKVLHFAQNLAVHSPKVKRMRVGIEGKELTRFASIIKSDEIQVMSKAIESGCEKIDADEW